jgi:hypothetical protein
MSAYRIHVHQLEVPRSGGDYSPHWVWRWFADCSCGFRSKRCDTSKEAQAEAKAHLEASK